MNPKFAPVVVAALLLTGCAQQNEKSAESERYTAPVYRTGSNLPAGRESPDSQQSREMSASDRKSVEDLQNRPRPLPPGVSK